MQQQEPRVASSPEPITGNTRPARPPVTASPAFAWVVALWFAALLGVGSLIMPVALLESVSTATGLSAMVPQAAPPLGFTAQALLALVGTVGGGGLGFALTRRLARGKAARPAPARRVLSAREDLAHLPDDEDEFDGPQLAAPGGRRRALAMAEEERPSDFLHVVPLPGGNAHDDDGRWVDEAEFELIEEGEAPFELDEGSALADDDLVEDPAEELFDQGPSHPFDAPSPDARRQEFVAVAAVATPVVEPEPEPEPQVDFAKNAPTAQPLVFSPPSMLRAGVTWRDPPVTGPAVAEANEVEFEPVEPPHDVRQLFMPESEEDVSDKPDFDVPQSENPEAEALVPFAATTATPTDGEGLVQLVQRLGATLEKHREWVAEQAAMRPAEASAAVAGEPAAERAVPEEFDPAAPDEAAEAMAAWFGKPAIAPAPEPAAEAVPVTALDAAAPLQYAPFAGTLAASDENDDDDDLSDLAASFTLPLAIKPVEPAPQPRPAFDQPPPSAGFVAPAAGVAEEAEEDADDSAASDDFGSLNPFRQQAEQFVRVEEPEPEPGSSEPAVLFPGQEARRPAAARAFDPPAGTDAPVRSSPSNDDNARALREALLNLQRMGK